MNNISLLIGRITKEVELRYSASGNAHASFTIAVKRQFKDKKTGEYLSDFINCKIFGKSAEFLANYTSKGSQIAVQGSIQTGKYQNKEGNTVYTTDVMVQNVTLLDSKKDSNGSTFQHKENDNGSMINEDPFAYSKGPMEVSSEDLPF